MTLAGNRSGGRPDEAPRAGHRMEKGGGALALVLVDVASNPTEPLRVLFYGLEWPFRMLEAEGISP